MKIEIAKQMFNALKEEDKIYFINKIMPHSGAHRQLDNLGDWSDNQWISLVNEFIKSTDWAKGILLEKIDVHDCTHIVNGNSELGYPYEGIGYYSDNELLFVEDLEYIG